MRHEGTDVIADRLPAQTAEGMARAAALQAAAAVRPRGTSLVNYMSGGHVLVIGAEDQAIAAVQSLGQGVRCTVLATGTTPEAGPGTEGDGGVQVLRGNVSHVDGYLGAFSVAAAGGEQEVDLAALVQCKHFDVVLDLDVPAHLEREVLPPGYYAPAGDPALLEAALAEIPDLSGEFEKPKYFFLDNDICAHSRSNLKGCNRCIEACPTLAISSAGEHVEVDPHLCQGGGSCATACPSGAIRYVYPAVSDLLSGVRAALGSYTDAGAGEPCVLFHDAGAGTELLADIAGAMPERIIPFEVEEIGAVGMDIWLSTLAYGASAVVLLAVPDTPASVMGELREQLGFAHPLLTGMGHDPTRLQLLVSGEADSALSVLDTLPGPSGIEPARFAAFDEKRTTVRLALDHLHQQAPAPHPIATLPAGAPFGEVWLNVQRCTLCMACASVCPGKALLAGDQVPALKFIEANCVQCGLCARSCPEDAIGPSPRYLYDSAQRLATRVLHEEEPFRCVGCGKPFATKKMMETMRRKLSGHSMFQTPESRRRLEMCEDCRVRDMFSSEMQAGGGQDA